MPSNLPAIDLNVRTQSQRYRAHLKRGDGLFKGRRSQLEIRNALADYYQEGDEAGNINSSGYFVAPPRIGKTIIIGDHIIGINTTPKGEYVLGDKARQKRVLICVPTNQLVDQWADRLLGEPKADGTREKSLFGDRFTPQNVGVYSANMSDAQKEAVLSKPVVIITDDSVRILSQPTDKRPALIKRGDFDTVILDEVDERLRGDVHSNVFQELFFGASKVIGMTATELYRSGKTIGDYLFGGKKPICTITHQEAIDRREIAPNTTITFETSIDRLNSDIKVKSNNWNILTDSEKEKFIEQTGSDIAAIKIMKVGTHPQTGEKLSRLKSLWKGETVSHSIAFAEMLNKEFGEGYAAVVYGDQNEIERDEIMRKYKKGEIKALVQCKYLGRGFDDANIELTGQLAPSQSPNNLIQFFTRADTRKGSKIAVHIAPHFDGIDQLHIGELLGGQIMIPAGWEFPPTAGRVPGEPPELNPWPEIEGVKVYYTTEQTQQFAQKLNKERYVKGLPKKTDKVLNLDEMARRINIPSEILKQRVYEPLQQAYDIREARDKFVEMDKPDDGNVIHISGWKFPTSSIGYYRDEQGKEQFCIDEPRAKVCQRALYGNLSRMKTRPELLNKKAAQVRLGVADQDIDILWADLQAEFFKTKSSYAQTVNLNGYEFAYKDFGFFLNANGAPELCITADALKSAYRYCHPAAEAPEVARWAESPSVKGLKTSEWYTTDEITQELSLYGEEARFVPEKLEELSKSRQYGPQIKAMKEGEEIAVTVKRGPIQHILRIAKKVHPLAQDDKRTQLCLHRDELEWVKKQLGLEDAFDEVAAAKGAVKRG